MAGGRTFNDIHRGVPLISRAVLVVRLRELEYQGIIERRPRAEGSGHEYWLTLAGNAFRSVVSELGKWGFMRVTASGPPISIQQSCYGASASAQSLLRCRPAA
jgi:DNA-binding HxlR family transcriptional regulator